MEDHEADALLVQIEGVGTFDAFKSYRINSNYVTPTDGWEFTVMAEAAPLELRRRWRPLQPIRLYINGCCQVIGRIDGIETADETGIALRVFGRDYLADIVDSSVDPRFQISKGQSIETLLVELFRPWGISRIEGSHNARRNVLTGREAYAGAPERSYEEARLEDFKAEENQGVMEFANKVVARHGFTIQPAATRDAVSVDAPNYLQEPLYSLSRPGNVESATCLRDYGAIPTVVLSRSQTALGKQQAASAVGSLSTFNLRGKQIIVEESDVTYAPGVVPVERSSEVLRRGNRLILEETELRLRARSAPVAPPLRQSFRALADVPEVLAIGQTDSGLPVIRDVAFDPKREDSESYGYDPPVYKPVFFLDKQSRNQEQLDRAIRRLLAEKLRDSLVYRPTVLGHRDQTSGALWAVDTMVSVNDEIEGVNEVLWIIDRTFVNTGDGPKTELVCVRPASYQL